MNNAPQSYRSNAEWPAGTISGQNDNISTDTHATYEQAENICRRLQREGFGGDGLIFPLRTWVDQPTAPHAQPEQTEREAEVRVGLEQAQAFVPAATRTPRTDKAEFFVATTAKQSPDEGGMFVTSNFARQLERDLNAARAEVDRMSRELADVHRTWQSERDAHGTAYAQAMKQLAASRPTAEMVEACDLPIDKQALSLLGFYQRKGEFTGYPDYVFELDIEDADPRDRASLIVEKGNGSDDSCWTVRFFSWRGELSGGHTVTLKYGARKIGEIIKLIQVLHFNPEKKA